MNIPHITERLAGTHMGQCATHVDGLCDCGAVAPAQLAVGTASDSSVPIEHDIVADVEIDLKGTSDGKPE